MWRLRELEEIDDAPQILDSLDLPGIAKYMQSESCKHIFIMAGAGISTAAGIPDFRSPDTGLYANLARLKLPYPEAVFDINFFRRNPLPFYTLAHELAPGRYNPTLTHAFIRLLAEKGRLHTCFTQNIDTLERKAGVPAEKIVEAHGSFADQHCIDCGAAYPEDKMRDAISNKEIARCTKKKCNGLVKPDIVFFGESLPPRFFSSIRNLRDADLLIVMGTSLTVHPFASLTELVPNDCPRLLCNLDHVGGWGSRANDVAALMRVDDAVRELCKLLGWEKDLMKLFKEVGGTPTESASEGPGETETEENPSDEGVPAAAAETVRSIVDDLSKAVEEVNLNDDKTQTTETASEPTASKDGDETPVDDTYPLEGVARGGTRPEYEDSTDATSQTTDSSTGHLQDDANNTQSTPDTTSQRL